ncbi:B12-binding domain-containing radical SAM protein [Chloroflexota bacterium]
MERKPENSRKVVLVYPRFPESLPALSLAMGPFYVGSYLVSQGYNVTLLDANNFKHDKEFFDTLRAELSSAFAVGLSVMTGQIPDALEISRCVKQLNPSVPIVWGGVHPSLFPEQTANCKYVDFAVHGEGEITMFELLKALDGQLELEQVRGVAFKSNQGDKVIVTGEREFADFNELPPVRWELLEDIKPGSKLKLSEIAKLTLSGIYLQTSRGCPHRCSFCINSVLKNSYRERRSDLVLKDIEKIIESGVDKIWIMDEIFFANKKRVTEILDRIEKKGLKFKWFGDIRADYLNLRHINDEFLLRVKQSGCEIVGIGAESGSPRILKMLTKDITVEDTLNAARALNKAGIKANFSFMTGLPGEEEGDILQTLQLIEGITEIDTSLSFRILGPQVYRPYPGSELYSECLKQGMKEPATLEEWASSPYIKGETLGKAITNPDAYPWIKHPSEFINNVVFYGSLSGIRLRYPLITKFLRKIASLRCKKLYFKYPVERHAYNFMMKTGAYKLLRVKSVL